MMGSARTIRITGAMTGGAYSLNEQVIAPLPALGSPLHMHEREDETFYIISGRLTFQVEEELVEANAGDTVWAPRGQRHAFWNPGPEPAHILTLVSPAAALTLGPAAKPDMEKVQATARSTGSHLYPREMLKV